MVKKLLKKSKNGLFGAAIAASTPIPDFIKPVTTTLKPQDIVTRIINAALFFIGAIALVFVIWGGIQYVTSGGDSEKTTKARNTLLYAIIGIIIVVLAWSIVSWASGGLVCTIANGGACK